MIASTRDRFRGYASHIRRYCQPDIGYVSIDRLRVTDVASVFEAIDELNEAITEARTSEQHRPQPPGRRRCRLAGITAVRR